MLDRRLFPPLHSLGILIHHVELQAQVPPQHDHQLLVLSKMPARPTIPGSGQHRLLLIVLANPILVS